MRNKKGAFTLVELIIVMAILAILWTVAFISLKWYTKNSRNSLRVTDIWSINQSLSIFETKSWIYPLPTNSVNVTFSWWLLWYQWVFWEDTIKNLTDLNQAPIDPQFWTNYDYSVINHKKQYQISTVLEDWLLWYSPVNKANATTNNEVEAYVKWNYIQNDVKAVIWTDCLIIPAPSLLISNTNSSSDILPFWYYNFVIDKWLNLTSNYTDSITIASPWKSFQVQELYNKCSMSSVDEFNLYISKLSVAYQQLKDYDAFKNIVYDFNTPQFRENAVNNLLSNGINIHKNVVFDIKNPDSWYIFNDTFTESNWTNLVWHTADTFWTWTMVWAIWSWSYQISWNQVVKTDSLSWIVFPSPYIPIGSWDASISFNIVDFAWWSVFVYLRYIDDNNYVWVEITPSWYTRKKMDWWVQSIYDSISTETFWANTTIEFKVSWSTLTLVINNIDKSDINDNFPLWINAWISMSQNAKIDNFNYIYK